MELNSTIRLFLLIVIGVILSIISRFFKIPLLNWFLNNFEEAMAQASNPDDFDLRLRGITGSSDRWDEEGESDHG